MAEKKYALVTGGSSGLGLAIANNLAAKGYVPVIVARRKENIDEAVNALTKAGFEAYGFKGDITSQKDLTEISDAVKKQFGKLDFLVLNAGIVTVGLLSDYTDYGKMKADIDVDLWGTILSTRIFMPFLVKGLPAEPGQRAIPARHRRLRPRRVLTAALRWEGVSGHGPRGHAGGAGAGLGVGLGGRLLRRLV